MNQNPQLTQSATEFLETYYRDEITQIANQPSEHPALVVNHLDLYQYDQHLADDLLREPDTVLDALERAIHNVDIPHSAPSTTPVRVTGLDDAHVHAPSDIRETHGETYVGVRGILERVTSTSDLPESIAFECQRCGVTTTVPQSMESGELREPHSCSGCERNGPFRMMHDRSTWHDYAKIRVEGTPGASEADTGKLTGYVLNDLIEHGGPQGLIGRAGEPVTVYGIIRRVQKTGRGENSLLFDHVMDVRAVEFTRDRDTIDVQAHRDTFTELAERPDAVDLFARSIAPNLHETDAWSVAMEFAVAYLFGAPRIDIENGPTYRGDLHFLIVSDYGMGKSDFASDIEAYSPKCIFKSTTALSSDVGLTAAAVKDDFGEGQWTLKPGLLVKANGGHLILDEIDKGPDDLTDMNDALEGKQQVDVEKAGKSATYDSRTAVMAMGNPVNGSFDPNESVPDQLGIKESLLSRFDGIVTMTDHADVTVDRRIAETFGKAYTEAQQAAVNGDEDFDVLAREVPIDVGRAWIQYAREHVDPVITYSQFRELEDWYAEEVRQLNHDHSARDDMPVPATVRKLAAAVKMSLAFARVHLRDYVTDRDIERAKRLGKQLVRNNWDGEKFDANKHTSKQAWSQEDRREWILEQTRDEAVGQTTLVERAGEKGMDTGQVRHDIEVLYQSGMLIEPSTGKYRAT